MPACGSCLWGTENCPEKADYSLEDYKEAVCPPETSACSLHIPKSLEIKGKGIILPRLVIEPSGKGWYAWKLDDERGLSKVEPAEKKQWKLKHGGWEVKVNKSFLNSLPYKTPRMRL